ncbi:alcohol dehydrogenase catalytic domain-containing protein [Pseudomonas sp. NPDC090203]|uniref:alcohol dehydrogenase catalytic domain-containing protein n=1 Tax=Pseudomonas sp. NPDC090203 TaxID=3364477 RepID=UPI0038014D10
MRAVLSYAFCAPGAGAFAPADIPEPPLPAAGQALIAMEFAPVRLEYLTSKQRSSSPQRFPSLMGRDGVGRVLAVGHQVQNVRVGDRVLAPSGVSTWRQRLLVQADELYRLPHAADPLHMALLLRRRLAIGPQATQELILKASVRALRWKAGLIAGGRRRIPSTKVFPLWQIAEAFDQARSGSHVLLDLQAKPDNLWSGYDVGEVGAVFARVTDSDPWD